MSQFDVFLNPGKNTDAIPYVVVVQSGAFDKLQRRLVIPLLLESGAGAAIKIPLSDATPSLTVEGHKVVLNPFEMVSVETRKLKNKVASLSDDGDLVTAALDEVFSRARG
jgi:toxin CcdB